MITEEQAAAARAAWSPLHEHASRGDLLAMRLLCLRDWGDAPSIRERLSAISPSNGRTLQHAAALRGWATELEYLEATVGPTPAAEWCPKTPRAFASASGRLKDSLGPLPKEGQLHLAKDLHREMHGGMYRTFALQRAAIAAGAAGVDSWRTPTSPGNAPGLPPGRTLMHHAAMHGWLDACQHLLDAGLSMTRPDAGGVQPWHLAVAGGHGDMLDRLRTTHPAHCEGFPAEQVARLSSALVPAAAQLVGTPHQFRLPSVEDRADWVRHGGVGAPPGLRVLPREAHADGDPVPMGSAGAQAGPRPARRAALSAGSVPLHLPAPAAALPAAVASPGRWGRFGASSSSKGPKPAAPPRGPSPG